MKAVVVHGVNEVGVDRVDAARIESPTDVLLRVTSSAICGTDLHIYEGRMGDVAGMVIGHEPLGVVEDVGSAVVSVKKGDRVTVPTHICCGRSSFWTVGRPICRSRSIFRARCGRRSSPAASTTSTVTKLR